MALSASVKSIVMALALAGAVLGLYVLVERPYENQSTEEALRDVAIASLWGSPERYEGQMVRTSGTLRVFYPDSPEEHFVVEDDEKNRVALRGAPADEMSPFAGQRVTVVGRLGFAEDFGVYIDVVSLTKEGQ